MKRVLTVMALLVIVTAFAAPAALAAQNAIGAGFSSAPPGSIGPSISGDIYGNTSNPSGNGEGVLPSLSPGPWVCGDPTDCAGPTDPGGSMGVFLAPVASGGTASPEFAHGNDPDLDFSN